MQSLTRRTVLAAALIALALGGQLADASPAGAVRKDGLKPLDPAAERDRPTAILVSPIHEAQVVRGDDGMDDIEYDLLVVRVSRIGGADERYGPRPRREETHADRLRP